MPYKRRARLLVISSGDDRPQRVAKLGAAPAYADWLEIRAGPPLRELERAESTVLEWPDLLVCVDAATAQAAESLAARPGTCRLKRWALSSPERVTTATLDAEIHAALDCMVGGMRLLSRLDEAPPRLESVVEPERAPPAPSVAGSGECGRG